MLPPPPVARPPLVGCSSLLGSIVAERGENTLPQLTKLTRPVNGLPNSTRVDGCASEEIPAIPWEEVHVEMGQRIAVNLVDRVSPHQ